ncbi:MAG: 5'/3'-nucleotidase SurE, partial [Bacteroidota bacterium]
MIRVKNTKGVWRLGIVLFQLVPVGIILFHFWAFRNYASSSGWMQNKEGTCEVFTQANHENRHFTWSGDCENGLAEGMGQLLVFEGNRKRYRYEGHLEKGIINGYGKAFNFSDGDYYEGHFQNNTPSGSGHFYNDDGDHYEGFFEDGLKSGRGTEWYAPESPILKYVGQWEKDEQEGFGTLYFRNGEEKKGLFKSGKLIKELEELPKPARKPFKNILITNDDGVEDLDRLLCLADAVSEFAEMVVIVACEENRSSTTNYMQMPKQGYVEAECLSVDSIKQIYLYQIQGYPADCVLFGALGIFREKGRDIDLVISGINGGPNIGVEWFGSGTIGAARTAALANIPAIAISGVDEEQGGERQLRARCNWVAELVRSPFVEQIK